MKTIEGGVCAAQGFTAAGVHCGIRKNKTKRDLALIYSSVPASAAAVYTTNLVKGAPSRCRAQQCPGFPPTTPLPPPLRPADTKTRRLPR